uniref:Uncharacterized protein n=1 Tax=Anguilla anguilla TaxID=7936 RepID=A0A0E9RMG8_ANGAN
MRARRQDLACEDL